MAVRKDENVQALVDKISNLPAFDPSNAREFHSNYEEEGFVCFNSSKLFSGGSN
jgi:hypothetical protein